MKLNAVARRGMPAEARQLRATRRAAVDAAAKRAAAAQIAQATGVPVEVALQAMADTHSNQAVQNAGAAQALSAAEAQHRHELLMQDRLFGQTALQFRHLQQLNTVAQQVAAVLPQPPLVDASGDATMPTAHPDVHVALDVSGASSAGTPGADTLPPTPQGTGLTTTLATGHFHHLDMTLILK